MEEKPIYPTQLYKSKEGDMIINKTPTSDEVKGKKIARWFVQDDNL